MAESAKFCAVCGSPLTENSNQAQRNILSGNGKNTSAGTGSGRPPQTGYPGYQAQQRGRGSFSGQQVNAANSPFRQQVNAANSPSGQMDQVKNPFLQTENANGTGNAAASGKKKHNWMLIAGAAVLAALLIAVFVVIRINAKPTIDLNKYVTFEVTGFNGYGKVSAVIDWDAIKAKHGRKIHFTTKAVKRNGGRRSGETALDHLKQNVQIELDRYEHLSNGDKIKYTWHVNDSVYDDVKVKLKYKEDEYKVSKLEEVETFDAFADVNVTFDGFAPDGTASFQYTGNLLNASDFSCDKTSGLSNGDVIKITWDDSNIDALVATLGKVPASTEKEYTVSGLDEYVTDYADLTEEFINTLHSEAEDTIYSYIASYYNETCAMSDLTYSGYILSVIKNPDDYGGFFSGCDCYNDLLIIYSGIVTDSEGNFRPTKVYYPVRFKNLIKSGDQITFGDNAGILGYARLGSWYSTKGYANPVLCHKEQVEENRDLYTAVCGDGFEKYSSQEDLSKAEDITEEYKNTLYADAKDIIEAYTAKNYKDGMVLGELSVLGEYFLLAKTQSSDYEKNNRYIIVYSATVSNSEGKFEPTVVYFPVEYDGLVKLTEDEFMVTSTAGLQGGYATFPGSYLYTKGYIDGTLMFSELVTANRANYTYEMTENLKQFGE